MTLSRRKLFIYASCAEIIGVGLFTACTPAQQASWVEKDKRLVQKVTDIIKKYLGGIAPALVAKVEAANAKVQAAMDLAGEFAVALPIFLDAVQAVLRFSPLPSSITGPINIILSFLSNLAGKASGPSASREQAVAAAQALEGK